MYYAKPASRLDRMLVLCLSRLGGLVVVVVEAPVKAEHDDDGCPQKDQ